MRIPRLRTLVLAGLLLALAFGAKAWSDTMADPAIQQTAVALADYPADAEPITIALLSDIHVSGPDMPLARLERIVSQVNALDPDIVMIAGDFVSDKRTATRHYDTEESIAPLADLRAPLGKIAVPGNHDHWRDLAIVESELQAAGFVVLANEGTRIGPLVVGGLDDDFTGHADPAATLAAMEGLDGAKVVLTHSPDPFPDLPPGVGLTLAGHTHCGQIGWPWGGSPATMSDYGQLYACGRVDEGARVLVTTGGLGTSVLPFRLFTRPEVWLISVSGKR